MRGPDGRFTTVRRERDREASEFSKAKVGTELGVSSKRRIGRTLYDDFILDLRGTRAAKTYREMADNDPVIGALLFAVEQTIREVEWHVEPTDDSPQAMETAEFVESCMWDMSHTWDDFIASVLTELVYGWSAFEIVYRWRRRKDGSMNDDGKIGWRKFAYRPQDTLDDWLTDEKGGIQGIRQAHDSGTTEIPIEALLLFRTNSANGRPEGKSILRTSYTSWYYKKRIMDITAIGVERDLAGLPMAEMPAESIIAQDATYNAVKDIVTSLKQDEQAGLIWPLEYDEGNPLYRFSLLQTGGRAKVDPMQVLTYLDTAIARSILADFLMLGQTSVGSRALADPKIEMFTRAIESWADGIAQVLNRHAVPRLLEINAMNVDAPTFTHTPVRDIDMASFAQAIQATAVAGMPWFGGPDSEEVENRVRDVLGFPPVDVPTLKRRRDGRWATS